jgi:hypothetical protein
MDGWMHRLYLILDTDRKEEGKKLFARFTASIYRPRSEFEIGHYHWLKR